MPQKAKLSLTHHSKVNKVLALLTLSDIFTWGFYVMVSSLAGIYLAKKIDGNPETYVGIGVAIYLLSRALTQIPLGILTDRLKKDVDEITFLSIGNILMGISYFSYPLITSPSVYFFLQFIFGLGASMNLVSWRKLFAQNLTQNKEGISYASYDFAMSFSTAILSVSAGIIAGLSQKYFDLVMSGSGLLMMFSSFFTMSISFVRNRKSIRSSKKPT